MYLQMIFLILTPLGIHLELSDIFPVDPAEWTGFVLTLHGCQEREHGYHDSHQTL